MQPMQDTKKDLSVFRPDLTPTAASRSRRQDISSRSTAPDWNSISPRVGFAYQPKFAPSFVVRGGGGIFFDTPNANPFLDNRPGNEAPNGLEGNPGGSNSSPVFTTAATTGAIPTLIVPGQEDHPNRDNALPRRPTPAAYSARGACELPFALQRRTSISRSSNRWEPRPSCRLATWAARDESC